MATSAKNNNNNNNGSSEEEEEAAKQLVQEFGKTLKDGERLVGPTRRPDGTLRKPIRIRAGFVPQDEVPIYQSKGTLWRKEKESQLPPGYDPETETKAKSKCLKRNERKKEKRQQAALDRAKNSEHSVDDEDKEEKDANDPSPNSKSLDSVASQIRQLDLSTTSSAHKSSTNPAEGSETASAGVDIDKKIRALKKKIRLAEAQLEKISPEEMKPEQLEKAKKLEGWREELKLVEGANKAEFSAS